MKKPLSFGKYLLLERINVGGMAEVFLAKVFGEHKERILAIKKIIPTMVEDEEFINMFLDEARIAVQLNHPNIVQIQELGKHEEHYYIAMEYVSGRDLRTMLDGVKKQKALLPMPLAIFVAQQASVGLDYAHRRKDTQGRDMNIVHRDVSPQNILVAYDGSVKVIDFGIAKAQNRIQKTQAGILKGKFGYMSPEQMRGLPIDRRSDLFALGVILYEMLTGERLFVGESDFSTLEKVRNAEVPPLRHYNEAIPPELERVVLRALAREPEDRYQWAAELADDLTRFLVQDETVFGQIHLGAYMTEVFAKDLQRDQDRLTKLMAVPRPEGTPISVLPPSSPRASAKQITKRENKSGPAKTVDEFGPDKTQLFDPDPGPASAPAFGEGPPTGPVGPALLPPGSPHTQEISAVSAVLISPVLEANTVIKSDGEDPLAAGPSPQGARSDPRAAATRQLPQAGDFDEPRTVAATSGPHSVRPVPALTPLPPSRRRGLPGLAVAAIGFGVTLVILALFLGRRPALGTLVISPDPWANAVIAIDGRELVEGEQHTFIARDLAVGEHTLSARNQNGTKVLKVLVEAGGAQSVQLPMAEPAVAMPGPTAPTGAAAPTGPAAAMGLNLHDHEAPKAAFRVTVETDPDGAEITVDRQKVGRGPYLLSAADPQHLYRLKAVAPGHHAAEKSLRFDRDQTVVLTLAAREAEHEGEHPPPPHHPKGNGAKPPRGPPGSLIISSRPVAKVSIDGRPTGRYTPVPPSAPLEIPSGDHTVHLESDDGKRADVQVSIQPKVMTKLLNVVLN